MREKDRRKCVTVSVNKDTNNQNDWQIFLFISLHPLTIYLAGESFILIKLCRKQDRSLFTVINGVVIGVFIL